MKNISSLLIILFITLSTNAQEVLAKIEYGEAEKSFQAEEYEKTLEHLEKVKQLLGNTNAKVMYLEILALNEVIDIVNPSLEVYEDIQTMNNLSKLYISSFENDVPLDKLKDVYQISLDFEPYNISIEKIITAVELFKNNKVEEAFSLMSTACEDGNPLSCRTKIRLENSLINNKIKDSIVAKVNKDMILVEGGSFSMGGDSFFGLKTKYQPKPAHEVALDSFYISKYEVTFNLWEAVMGSLPEEYPSWAQNNIPIFLVSWDDAQEFIRKLNNISGENYRLPTEAEWEFAARGGNLSNDYKYSGSDDLEEIAHYDRRTPYIVGTMQPNELGIYDMTGNISELCYDYYDPRYYEVSPKNNPKGPSTAKERVYRGGSHNLVEWGEPGEGKINKRVTYRNDVEQNGSYTDIGFRLVKSIEQ